MYAKKYGKTIKLFLMDADPEGRMVCEISNWNGKAYRIPRSDVKNCLNRYDLQATAVYLLFGRAESSSTKAKVYIGEAENVYSRLAQHVSEKEFWTEAVVFVSKDETLNKAHIKYLESRLYEIALFAERYNIENNNRPTKSLISESDQAEMEEFIEYIKILVNTMGYKVFQPLVARRLSAKADEAEYFFLTGPRGANGKGKRTADGFVVVEGSHVARETTDSFPTGLATLRDELIESGVIVKRGQLLIFSSDYLFSSPSAAAAVMLGRSANGLTQWRNVKNQELKAVESAELVQADGAFVNPGPEPLQVASSGQ